LGSTPVAKISEILETLAKTNSILSLGLVGANIIVPLIKGAIVSLRKLKTNSDGTVDYEVVISVDQKILEQDAASLLEAQDLLNSELVRLGHPPVTLGGT